MKIGLVVVEEVLFRVVLPGGVGKVGVYHPRKNHQTTTTAVTPTNKPTKKAH